MRNRTNIATFGSGRKPRLASAGIAALAAWPLTAQQTARMQLPDGLAVQVERQSFGGFGGRNEGRYTLGELTGDFTRIESRWAIADPFYAQNRARSSFTVAGPGFESAVAATCEMQRTAVTVGVVTFDPEKMTYQCDLAGAESRLLVLGQPKPENFRARLLARAERRGAASFRGVTLEVRSVHRYAGSRLEAPMPVGYLLERDGRAVAAVELTDVDPTLYFPIAESAEVRAATIVTALALAVLRDPATSALDD